MLATTEKAEAAREFRPLLVTICGCAGAGKGFIFKWLVNRVRKLFNSRSVVQIATPTRAAAYNVDGETVHRTWTSLSHRPSWVYQASVHCFTNKLRLAATEFTSSVKRLLSTAMSCSSLIVTRPSRSTQTRWKEVLQRLRIGETTTEDADYLTSLHLSNRSQRDIQRIMDEGSVMPRPQPYVSAFSHASSHNCRVWIIMISLPGGNRLTQYCDNQLSASELHSRVIETAATTMAVPSGDLYSLFNGRYYAGQDAPIHSIGMHDMCTVDVLVRIRGGVFIRAKASGKKRPVSK